MDTWIVPLHRPSRQLLLRDRIFPTRQLKVSAVIEEIQRRSAVGQPVLVGTRTLENSEQLAAALEPTGVPFSVLNAKNETEEARLIELAGQPGAVTIATNMAGRGAHIPVPKPRCKPVGCMLSVSNVMKRPGSTASWRADPPAKASPEVCSSISAWRTIFWCSTALRWPGT